MVDGLFCKELSLELYRHVSVDRRFSKTLFYFQVLPMETYLLVVSRETKYGAAEEQSLFEDHGPAA